MRDRGVTAKNERFISALNSAMREAGTNANRLAKELGRDSSYVYNLLHGKKKSVGAGDLAAIERKLGISAGGLSQLMERYTGNIPTTVNASMHRGRRASVEFRASTQDVKQKGAPRARMLRVSIDFPEGIARRLDREAQRLGVESADLIKVWVDEKMRSLAMADRAADPRRSLATAQMPIELRDLALEALDRPYEP